MVTLAGLILVCVCLILLGALQAAPYRWVIVGLAVLAFLLFLFGGLPIAGVPR